MMMESVRNKSDMVQIGATFIRAYLECSPELQNHVRELLVVLADSQDEQETKMTLHTLQEILYPERHDAGVTLEHLEECALENQPDAQLAKDELDREEATFAERLSFFMGKRDMTQVQLAEAIGVGQPAISMMLNRKCRPQRATVERIANALKITAAELWPRQ